MLKTILQGIFIFGIGGCIAWIVIANEDKQILKEHNQQYQDTPKYFKRYMETSVVYKRNYKH